MKLFKYTFLLAVASLLMAAECTKEDDEFYNSVYITVPNLVTIETKPTFLVNDYIWLNTNNLSRFINEPNQNAPLDIYATTKADKFRFLYSLEKLNSGGTWSTVTIGTNFLVDKGEVNFTNGITANAVYNSTTQKYEYRVGLKLLQPGQYRIITYTGFNGVNFDLISVNQPKSTFLTIATTTNVNGHYVFTVI
jgi:hypothetical protein